MKFYSANLNINKINQIINFKQKFKFLFILILINLYHIICFENQIQDLNSTAILKGKYFNFFNSLKIRTIENEL